MGRSSKRKTRASLPSRESSTDGDHNETVPATNENRSNENPQITDFPSVVRRAHIPVKDWGIKFDGESGSAVGVMTFLHDLETLRVARRYSHNDLLAEAIDLFTGPALIWFRSVNRHLRSWDELVSALKKSFQPKYYSRQLWQEIRSRTQGPQEPIAIYLAVMKNYFDRLPTPPSESEKLEIVRPNLLPYLVRALALVETTTLDHLEDVAREIEEAECIAATSRPDPPSRKTLLQPDLAYHSRKRDTVRVAEVQAASDFRYQKSKTDEVQNRDNQSSRPTGNRPRCWNCDAVGHTFRFCFEEQKIFCVGCGKKGLAKKNCPTCSGNAKASPRQAGNRARFANQSRPKF